MTIASELTERLWTLADPKVKWVARWPKTKAEACVILDGGMSWSAVNRGVLDWLDDFCRDYAGATSSTTFNDHHARSRSEVIWMLEEAIEAAKAEGV